MLFQVGDSCVCTGYHESLTGTNVCSLGSINEWDK